MTSIEHEVVAARAKHQDAMLAISHDIHRRPEVAFEESFAHDVLTDFLEHQGFTLERSAFGLETAFRAVLSNGSGPRIGLVCEYDALPEIGHACGHNVIAAAGAGAAAIAAELLADRQGTVIVLGTPAEESGAGKVLMLERDAFAGLDAAMMVHPAGRDLTHMNAVAIERRKVTYHGRAAHAAAAPDQGLNALDAAVLGYMNVAALRQHLKADERVHGVITNGGVRANVVPELAEAEWFTRSPSLDGLHELSRRVQICLEAGANAAGCTCIEEPIGRVYQDLRSDADLVTRYVEAAALFGRLVEVPNSTTRVVGSTDMGNVSHVVPSIHPMIKAAPDEVSLHTRDFADYAGGPDGDRAVLDGAGILASVVGSILRHGPDQESRPPTPQRQAATGGHLASDS
ncbi:putative Peptidase M20 domain-containing protein 2 [Nocardioides sp. PD653]|nr:MULTISPECIES: M20 family metallopeptidase [unclassified Nocardioides]GAW49148.1 Putative Peptidase M20 domain-containing protein 2 [Nocardioides sp. PD653-B2]GAW55636.1 putative Peptidase M20 domain-containing protein 2 [Nocardioides sp. PD653]